MVSLSRRPRPSSIEPLEARIAPALLINGANLLVAGSANSVGETSVGDNSVEVVKVTSGQAIVWFQDGAILGISFGANTSLEITGDILGDIVGNLTPEGRLSDSDGDPSNGEDGAVLLANNLTGLKLKPFQGINAGMGNVITGGSVSNLKIDGEIRGIYAGDGAFQADSHVAAGQVVLSDIGSLDFNPIQPGIQNVFVMSLEDAKADSAEGTAGLLPGASIQNVEIGKALELQMFAGSGNPNGLVFTGKAPAGGSIRNVLIDTAYSNSNGTITIPSYDIRAGHGESGGVGGAGGSIDKVIEKSSSGGVKLQAGDGGNGLSGAGGAGGSISNLDLQSDSSQYAVTAGKGGNGTPGGAGGSVRNSNFANRTPIGGVIVAADFTGDGVDDVLVADQGTGQMVLNRNIGDGANFQRVIQYINEKNEPVEKIGSKGITPSDAKAVDIDGDNDIDLIVAYKNSNSIAVYLNQGNGVFWDASLGEDGDFAGFTVSLGLSPTKLALMDEFAGRIAVAGILDGKGALQLISKELVEGEVTLGVDGGVNKFALPIADIVASSQGGLFMAAGDGKIERLRLSGSEKQPFEVIQTGISVPGGIADLDIDSAGDRLLALGASGRVLYVYDILSGAGDSSLSAPISVDLAGTQGRPLVAKFVDDGVEGTEDRLVVLHSLTEGSRISIFNPLPVDNDPNTQDAQGYVADRILSTTQTLKNMVPAYSKTGPAGFAALAGSLSQFTFGDDFLSTEEYALPFADKKVEVTAGAGGIGMDLGQTKLGKGGAGGAITGINIDANTIELIAGKGGDAHLGAGGAGGAILNPASFKSASGIVIAPALRADTRLSLTAGDGGDALEAGTKKTAGGAGGSISGLSLEFALGEEISIIAGDGGDGRGGAGGAGGTIKSIRSLAHGGSFTAEAGDGGEALAGKENTSAAGGAGGSILDLSHVLQRNGEEETVEAAVTVSLKAGGGGESISGAGGAGGSLVKIALNLDAPDITFDDSTANPPREDAERDSTVTILLTAGAGATGTKGGNGGSITDLKYESVFDQLYKGEVKPNYYVMQLTAGDGGRGTNGNGGNGGNIDLKNPISGIRYFDKDSETPFGVPLIVTAGTGGDGSVKGGLGGSVNGLVAQNSLFIDGSLISNTQLAGAVVTAGNGGNGGTGDGGRGGDITGGLIGIQGGYLQITAGHGGHGGVDVKDSEELAKSKVKGGAGGNVKGGEFGVVSTIFNAGILITGGNGGDGILSGGVGGAVASVRLNASQSTNVPLAMVIAGAGGDANSVRGAAGKGGDITGLTQAKDVNSSINLIQAGNGGDNPLGKGGAGGNVSGVRTVGFIGRPSELSVPLGIFDEVEVGYGVEIPTELFHDTGFGTVEFAQGLFVGRGGQSGDEQPAALNGSVKDVVARQIAAISAAMDPATRLFAAVEKISKVKTDLIGYDADRGTGNAGDGHFNDSLGGSASPDTVVPRDGFLFTKSPLTPANGVVVKLLRDEFVFPRPSVS